MRSCLYECRVMHARLAPRAHHFAYRIFLFALDLDELDTLPGHLRLFAVNRRNLYAFHERDYLPTDGPRHHDSTPATPAPPGARLKERVAHELARHGVDLAGGRVLLVTLPRILGHHFNPVSFYFCYDRSDRPLAVLAEVTNTFREMKPYFLAGPPARGTVFAARVPKHFYVSPFSEVDVAFDFTLRVPDERLAVRIDDFAGAQRTLTSTLTGPRRALTSGRLLWYAFKYPLLSVRILLLIHWHALRLWLKRVPWFAKAARPGDQRDLYRPHASLAQPSDPA